MEVNKLLYYLFIVNGWQDTRRKLDVLLTAAKPPLYSLAILLAAEEQLDPVEIMSLYKVKNDVFQFSTDIHTD